MNNEGRIKFDWLRYIIIAENIYNDYGDEDDNEAWDRCGISRAYYGAFHLTVAYMKLCGIFREVVGEGSHKTVIDDCITYGKNPNRSIGRLWNTIGCTLKNMKAMRVKADYKDRYWEENVSPSLRLKSELKKAGIDARKVEECIKKLRELEK